MPKENCFWKNLAKVEQSILEQAAKILFSESRASSEIQLRSFFLQQHEWKEEKNWRNGWKTSSRKSRYLSALLPAADPSNKDAISR